MAETSHAGAVTQVFQILRGNVLASEDALAATIGLYGLRVLASSPQYFSWTSASFARYWQTLKRTTVYVAKATERTLVDARRLTGVSALRYVPNYRKFKEESLTEAILTLDKLNASVDDVNPWVLIETMHDLLYRQDGNSAQSGKNDDFKGLPSPLLIPWPLDPIAAHILTSEAGTGPHSIYDPTCGVGTSLRVLFAGLQIRGANPSDIAVYGQDTSEQAVFIAAWHLLFSGASNINLEVGDTLRAPAFRNGNALQRFDFVITQPPVYPVTQEDLGSDDAFGRFRYGVIQKHRADYAFVQHAVASLNPDGRAAIFVPVSILSRSGFEDQIRAGLAHADILSAVIAFQGEIGLRRQTPAAILVFDLAKPWKQRDSVFFADVPFIVSAGENDGNNPITDFVYDVGKLIRLRQEKPGVSKEVHLDELRAMRYNLSPHSYIKRSGPKHAEISALEDKLRREKEYFQRASKEFDKAISKLHKIRTYVDEGD